jgi:DNA-3-methyladenine glycosylase II
MPGERGSQRLSVARAHLREADPVLARLIDEHPGFDPRAWMAGLAPMDAYGALLFQIVGQQLSVSSTRAILLRLQAHFDGQMPTPVGILAADPDILRASGLSRRKIETIRTLAERFASGELSEDAFAGRSDEEIEATLTSIPGIGPWTVHGFLIIALDRPDVLLPGDLALRRAVRNAYGLQEMPTEQETVRLAEPWRPFRTLAVGYLFASELAA